ncbi:hypothetical protein Pint_31179 [Pistacia integerrima]|uniref:Uncharacterized protein n=1 Tax=Pistacia integerrima TaxID=434235 RepID=A0ACC0XQQ3_9ROSI|nr:hypothetical protein Pint_31179 [Pistacia integerrima]
MKETTHRMRIMKTSAIYVEERAIGHVPVVCPSTCWNCIKHRLRTKR